MKETMARTAEAVLSSPKTAAIVAPATVAIGGAEIFGLLRDGLGLVAVVAGIYLTTVLIRKHRFELRVMRENHAHEIKKRKKAGLPIRRATDEANP